MLADRDSRKLFRKNSGMPRLTAPAICRRPTLPLGDAFRAVAAQSEEKQGAEFGRYGMGEQPRRPLDIQQNTVDKSPCQPAFGQPSVAEPVNMEDKEKHAQPTGELHDTFKGPQIIFLLHGRGILSGKNTPARNGSGSMSAPGRSSPHRNGFGCISADCIPRGCCAGNPENGSAAACG